MKFDRVLLSKWQGKSTDGYLDIPWPQVHKENSTELIQWLNSRNHTEAQMILEGNADGKQTLWAEFYQIETRREFALRFAK